jgi:hypothetical protein
MNRPVNMHFAFCKPLQLSLVATEHSCRIPAGVLERSNHGVPGQSFDDYLDLLP